MSGNMRTSRTAAVAVLALAMIGVGAACGGDDDAATTTSAPEMTAAPETTAAPATTAAPETTAAPATTAAPETTAASGTTPPPETAAPTGVEVGDFEGPWEAASFVVTSRDDPSVTLDVIALGVVLSAEADGEGNVTGQVEVPEALGGPVTLDFVATFDVLDQETMAVAFDPDIPPLLTSSAGPFTFDGRTLTIVDENTVFDFDDGNGEVPASAVTTLVMMS